MLATFCWSGNFIVGKFATLFEIPPLTLNVFTFISEFPTELEITKYIDYGKQFDKAYVEPLKFITNAINWYIDDSYGTQATLMDFFN